MLGGTQQQATRGSSAETGARASLQDVTADTPSSLLYCCTAVASSTPLFTLWRQFSLWSKGAADNRTTQATVLTALALPSVPHLAQHVESVSKWNGDSSGSHERTAKHPHPHPLSNTGKRSHPAHLLQDIRELARRHQCRTHGNTVYRKHTPRRHVWIVVCCCLGCGASSSLEHQRARLPASSASPRIACRPFLAVDRFSSELHNRNLASLPGCNVRTPST